MKTLKRIKNKNIYQEIFINCIINNFKDNIFNLRMSKQNN